MIPSTIQREHVILAAKWIDQNGIGQRVSKKYQVIVNGRPYPPKLIISKAYFYAHGSDWPHGNFHGGEETNSFLNRLGFKIIGLDSVPGMQEPQERHEAIRPRPSTSVLDRVKSIARDLKARVTTVESDSGEGGHDSRLFLIIHLADGNDKDIHIFSETDGEDDILYAFLPMEFNPSVSGYVGDAPEEKYAEFLRPLMRGRTHFRIELEGSRLKGVELRQTVPVPAGDDTLGTLLMAALLEIAESEASVRGAIRDQRTPSRDSIGQDKASPLRDNMFA